MKVLGISSGMGVSLYAFRDETILGNVEPRACFHTKGNIQWNMNYPGIYLEKKVNDMWLHFPSEDEVDLIVSSPDCGSGSILRLSVSKQYGSYKDNPSLDAFFEGVQMFKPKFFYFENLEKFFSIIEEKAFKEKVGDYRLKKLIAPVSNWGNSQIHRKRLVVIGIRNDITLKVDKYFKLPHLGDRAKTCIELYGDLDRLDHDEALELVHVRESEDDLTTIHSRRKLPNWEITEIWNQQLKGQRRWKVDGRDFTTAPGVYRNRRNDYPATARKASRQYDHKGTMLTPRQLARIQGIPDHFEIYMDIHQMGYWINKGRLLVTKTPPYEISLWLRKKLQKIENLNIIS